jgi:hypothetical protein
VSERRRPGAVRPVLARAALALLVGAAARAADLALRLRARRRGSQKA